MHPVNIQQQRHDRNHDSRTDIRRIQPVIKLPVFKNKNQRQKKNRPQNTAQPIYPVQRQRLHKPKMSGKQGRTQPYDKQQSDNQPMHVSPVSPIPQINSHQPRQLNTPQHDKIHDRKEHREITSRRDTELHARQALERPPHTQHPGNKTHPDQHGKTPRAHRDQITNNQRRTNHQENRPGSETKLQPEKNRKNNRCPHERSITRHHDILLHQRQRPDHLRNRRQINPPAELKRHGKKQTKKHTYPVRNKIPEHQDTCRYIRYRHLL